MKRIAGATSTGPNTLCRSSRSGDDRDARRLTPTALTVSAKLDLLVLGGYRLAGGHERCFSSRVRVPAEQIVRTYRRCRDHTTGWEAIARQSNRQPVRLGDLVPLRLALGSVGVEVVEVKLDPQPGCTVHPHPTVLDHRHVGGRLGRDGGVAAAFHHRAVEHGGRELL